MPFFSPSSSLNAIKPNFKSELWCLVENVLNVLGSQADTSARLLLVTLRLPSPAGRLAIMLRLIRKRE